MDKVQTLTKEEMLEWHGSMDTNHRCETCVYVGRGEELNDVGWCYNQECSVDPNWGCCEHEVLL